MAEYVTDEVALLVDPETDEILGLQVDDLLSVMAPMQPTLYDALVRGAELRGITPAEVAALRARSRSPLGRLATVYRGWAHRRRAPSPSAFPHYATNLSESLPPELRPVFVGLGLS